MTLEAALLDLMMCNQLQELESCCGCAMRVNVGRKRWLPLYLLVLEPCIGANTTFSLPHKLPVLTGESQSMGVDSSGSVRQ